MPLRAGTSAKVEMVVGEADTAIALCSGDVASLAMLDVERFLEKAH